ncbi:MAG: NADAR family protein [Bacteroidales bacterium]|nr:NADAR family protein [Bacteroidales bacterium]
MRLEGFIKEFYPEWYGIQEYPANKTAAFCKVAEEWGLLGNFAPTPIVVGGVPFDCTEKLFQVMKFTDLESRNIIYAQKGQPIKMKAKHQEKVGVVREDWGRIFIDAMKFCLMQKYNQSETFRNELERSKGLFIVEQQANPRRPAGAYSAKLSDDGNTWAGPNIMGRLLMELRDKGTLEYNLPADAMDFSDLL